MRVALITTWLALLVTPAAAAAVPVTREARAVNTSHPDRWIGRGNRGQCGSEHHDERAQ